jgi:hypothetical protein
MGVINVKTDLVRPTQDYLVQSTIDFYLRSLRSKKPLPPVPALASLCYDGRYDVLDGHHNLAVAHAHTRDVVLWVPESPRDFMPYSMFPEINPQHIDTCNQQIQRRFTMAPFYVPSDHSANDILTIDALISHAGVKLSLDRR